MDTFRYCTLLALLAAEDLALISVWSPTFLTTLLAPLEVWQERLCFDLRRGSLSPPVPLIGQAAQLLRGWLRPDPVRADRLTRILRSRAPWSDRLRRVWPH